MLLTPTRYSSDCPLFCGLNYLCLIVSGFGCYLSHACSMTLQMPSGYLVLLFLSSLRSAWGNDTVPISAVSWNVNSAAKIRSDPQAISLLTSCDVIFLQETLHTRAEDCLLLPGFVGQHSLAIPTNRRPSRGVSSFFRIASFVDGSILQVFLIPKVDL
jgi:hypothetical protein